MSDPTRLVHCISCGNKILLDDGDSECYYCHEPLPKTCPLAEPERARFTNLAGFACLLVRQTGRGDMQSEEDLRLGIWRAVLSMARAVGVSPREILDASLQLARSKDKERWLTEMTQL